MHIGLKKFFYQFILNFFLYFWGVLGLCCCMWALSSFGDSGLLYSCSAWASHCGGFSGCSKQALEHAGFSSWGYRA